VMLKAFTHILAMAALALACGTGYNFYNLANKDPRSMTWVMDERLRGMDLLTSSASQSKEAPLPANPAPAVPHEDATPEPAQPSQSKEPPSPEPNPLTEKATEPPKEA